MTGKSSSAWAVDQRKIILAVEHTQVSHDGATDLLRCYYCWHLLHWGNPLAIWCQMASNMYTAWLDKVMYVFISTVLNITSTSITSSINQSFVYCSQRQSRMKCTHFWRVFFFFFSLLQFSFPRCKSSCWLQSIMSTLPAVLCAVHISLLQWQLCSSFSEKSLCWVNP